jgi:BASS family bile acid:Na+ symporter
VQKPPVGPVGINITVNRGKVIVTGVIAGLAAAEAGLTPGRIITSINGQSFPPTGLGIALKMFFVVTVPVIIGMVIRHFAENFIISRAILFQRLAIILFVIVFVAIYVSEWEHIYMFITRAGTYALILNLTMMILSFYIAKFFVSGVAQQRSISIECGLQNGTLAVFVGTQIFGDTALLTYMVPTAAYVLIMMITSIIFVFILKKNT